MAAPPPERRNAAPRRPDGAEDWIADTLIKPFTDMAVKALGSAGDGVAARSGMLARARKRAWKRARLDLARLAYQVLRDAAALALMPDDSKTRLKGTARLHQAGGLVRPIPLDEVKAVGKALNCSINDVLLSCVAGAIGEYLRAHWATTCRARKSAPWCR
jgi:diacylglycerol O-acyltransferase